MPLNGNLDNKGLSDITATNYGATVDNNGKLGKCYSFNGSSNYITIPSFSIPENFSICIWGKWNSLNNWSRLLDFGSLASGKGYGFLIANSNTTSAMTFAYECGNGGSTNVNIGTINIGTWYHIAVTFQGANIKIYLNGNLVKAVTSANPVGGHTMNYNYLGKSNWSSDALLNGYLSDFRIYDHCLSPLEIKQISQGLICNYKLGGVGNENLIKNSNFHNGATNWTMDSGTLTISSDEVFNKYGVINVTGGSKRIYNSVSNVWVENQIYTVSFYAKSDISGTTILPSRSLVDYGSKFSLTTEWKKYICQIISTATVSGGTLSLSVGTINTNVYIANVKLEKGVAATPWCPAPSDTIYSTLGYNDGIEYDCSGYGNHGTKVGNIAWSGDSARYSGSYYLGTETATYVNAPNFNFENMTQGTVSLWINRHSTNSNWRNYLMFANGYNWTGNGYDFIILGSTGSQGITMDCCSNTYTFTPDLNKWYLYTLSWDLTTHTAKMYVNGELKQTRTDSKIDTTYASKHSYHFIGNGWYAESDYSLSDFRLYSTCLSDEDIQNLYSVSASIDKTGILSAHEFVEGD